MSYTDMQFTRSLQDEIDHWKRQARLLGHDGQHDPWKPCPNCDGTGKVPITQGWQRCVTCFDSGRPGLVRDTNHYDWDWLCWAVDQPYAFAHSTFEHSPCREFTDHPTPRCGWVLLGPKETNHD